MILAWLACGADTVEVHRVSAGGVTAVWTGRATDDIQGLCFILPGDARCVPYTPKGRMSSRDWSFDIFSPDGTWVLLKEGVYGPYDVVKVAELGAFLAGGSPYMMAQSELGERFDKQKVMCVHHDEHWVDEHNFRFSCGDNPPKVVEKRVGTDAP